MTAAPDLRERRRLATQAEIEHVALELFARQGSDRTTVEAIAAVLADMSTEPGAIDRMLRVRCLVMEDGGLRSALQRLDAEQSRAFFRRIAAATGSAGVDLRTRVIAESLGAGLRAALDDWAARREGGEDTDLVAIYRQTCATLREITAG